VAPARLVAARDEVSVREQRRVLAAVAVDRDRVLGHHVRPVDEIADAAESLGFALREQAALGRVQAHEGGVPVREDPARRLEGEAFRHAREGEARGVEGVLARAERPAVERRRLELELLGVQTQRGAGVDPFRIAAQREPRPDPRVVLEQLDVEVDGVDQERWRRVILEIGDLGSRVPHEASQQRRQV
jgi:hypothetical protein